MLDANDKKLVEELSKLLYPKRDPSIDPCDCGTQRCYPAHCDAWLAHREWKRKNKR